MNLSNRFREEITKLVMEIKASVETGHFDINKICEDVVCGLFRKLYGFENIRNLNSGERRNFPALDLADDNARVAVQVTSDNSLKKIKETLKKIINHNLDEKYDRVIFYILTEKQKSYSEKEIDLICGNKIAFNVHKDILDYRDFCKVASTVAPVALKDALMLLLDYTKGADKGFVKKDFDPPEGSEILGTNLIEISFSSKLFIAEISTEVFKRTRRRKVQNQRKKVGEFSRKNGILIPSGFEVNGGRLITFYNLDISNSPFRHLVDLGTVESFSPSEYYEIDEDHERVFKSLLRFSLQEKFYKKNIMWQHEERKFIFLPRHEQQNKRMERWIGKKISSRMVFHRKFNINDKNKILSTRHFAFGVDFFILNDRWYVAITPDWFFSYGEGYQRSFYGNKLLSGLKRMENNRSVYNQFRFLASWLKNIDEKDLFSEEVPDVPKIKFLFPLDVQPTDGRALDESLWEHLHKLPEGTLLEMLNEHED